MEDTGRELAITVKRQEQKDVTVNRTGTPKADQREIKRISMETTGRSREKIINPRKFRQQHKFYSAGRGHKKTDKVKGDEGEQTRSRWGNVTGCKEDGAIIKNYLLRAKLISLDEREAVWE